jgi:signal transduction histidine kinase
MRLNSIRARALLALAFICMAIVSIMGGIWLYTTSQSIKKTVSAEDLHDSELMADFVQMYVESVETSEEFATSEPETIKAFSENNSTLAKAELNGLVASTPQDDIAFLVDRNGTLLYHTCRTPDSPQGTRAFVDLRKNASYVTGIFYSDEFRDYVFAVVSPVRRNGVIIGYVCDEVCPTDLYVSMMREKKDHIDHVILVDGAGRAIICDNRSLMEQHANLSSYTPVKSVLSGETGVAEHTGPDGYGRYISAYRPVPDTGWGLVISTRMDSAYRPLRDEALEVLIICALLIMALMILGYFASAYLIGPVERLSGTMRRVSGGDYEVSIEARRNDEIGDLERAFNSLVEEVKKRDERIRTEKDRSEFYLDLMGHDINNMNHAGMGYLELARDNLRGRVDARDMALIEKAYEALKGSSALIDNVRRIQKVQVSFLAPEVLDLGLLLAEVKDKYALYPGREITINYAPSSCKVRVCGLFREVLSNIVDNAVKHSDPSRPLTINMALSREKLEGKKYCRISIEDNGPGIPDEMKEAIFTRFHRGPTGARGKGLGLYIVKMLVEEYGGKVWAEDRVPGDHSRGARFVILMPAA